MSVHEWAWLATGLIFVATWSASPWHRTRLAGPLAWSAVGMFALSTCLANMYRWFPAAENLSRVEQITHAVLLWEIHIVCLVVLYSATLVILQDLRLRPLDDLKLPGAFAGIGLAGALIAFTADSVEEQKISEFIALACIATLAWFCAMTVPRRDFIARALWVVLAAAETLSVITYFECQILFTLDAERGTTSACSRLFGPSLQYIESTLMAPAWLYILFRWFKPRSG